MPDIVPPWASGYSRGKGTHHTTSLKVYLEIQQISACLDLLGTMSSTGQVGGVAADPFFTSKPLFRSGV